MLAALFALLAPPPAAPLLTLGARAGQSVTLAVDYPAQDVLLNREAPNLLRLSTPWQTVEAKPSGTVHPDPALADYFGKVNPLLLRVTIPANTKSGAYAAKLSAQLFVCDKGQRTCIKRDQTFLLTISVGPKNTALPVQWLSLRASDLRPPTLRR